MLRPGDVLFSDDGMQTKAHEFKDGYFFFRFYFDTLNVGNIVIFNHFDSDAQTPKEFSELRSFEEASPLKPANALGHI
jgi:hypothetical protein